MGGVNRLGALAIFVGNKIFLFVIIKNASQRKTKYQTLLQSEDEYIVRQGLLLWESVITDFDILSGSI